MADPITKKTLSNGLEFAEGETHLANHQPLGLVWVVAQWEAGQTGISTGGAYADHGHTPLSPGSTIKPSPATGGM